ncbi:putative phage abortive infection protein [Acinetobacter baumannii]|uniref:putative phage abortive infection protein n=1 Tax=Acinetobacter baumannii TaxID=470 RepID=UPI0034CDE6CD|nr:hypothetical protein [Acinetobacter baumannii]
MKKENSENQDIYLKKIEKQIMWSIIIAALLITLVLVSYFFHFHGSFNADQDKWGTFGDFVGGTLNPVLAALAFYWLTSSIRLQIQELRDTRGVLEETATHQRTIANLEEENVNTQQKNLALQKASLEKQIQAAEQQQQQIAIQNFENIFFELLKTKNDAIKDISFNARKSSLNSATGIEIVKITGKEAISRHLKHFKETAYESWEEYYDNYLINSFSSYFRICYQIVRLIDSNEILITLEKFEDKPYSKKQKQYFDIFKATLQQSELEALFYNCLNNYSKYKSILEKYGVFEALVNTGTEKTLKFISQNAYRYNITAYDRNPYYIKYFEEIEKIDISLNTEFVFSSLTFLENEGIIPSNLPDRNTKKLGGESFPKSYQDFLNLVLMKIKYYRNQLIDIDNELKCSKDLEEIKALNSTASDLNFKIKSLKEIKCLETIFYLVKYSIDFKKYVDFKKHSI